LGVAVAVPIGGSVGTVGRPVGMLGIAVGKVGRVGIPVGIAVGMPVGIKSPKNGILNGRAGRAGKVGTFIGMVGNEGSVGKPGIRVGGVGISKKSSFTIFIILDGRRVSDVFNVGSTARDLNFNRGILNYFMITLTILHWKTIHRI
jgi:hypothetical protein